MPQISDKYKMRYIQREFTVTDDLLLTFNGNVKMHDYTETSYSTLCGK